MKVFSYFVEPAMYTLDLIQNIHSKLDIKCAIINNTSSLKIRAKNNLICLENLSLIQKFKFIYSIWSSHNLIIINGYNNYIFIINFFLNLISLKKRYIGIESDTQLMIPKNIFKRIFKSIYLSIIFRNEYIIGFAGGSDTHMQLFSHYGMSENRIFLLPMMVDNKRYYNMNKNFPATFTFLYVGRIISTKNVDQICKIFIQRFSKKDAKLIIAGGGNKLDDLKSKFLCDKIHFIGPIFGDKLVELYHKSSVLLFPSTKEAWGLVVNEAMASALPVIAHQNVGSVHDLIHKKDTGFIICNWEDLESKMNLLYNNKELCLRLSKNSYSIMKQYWNYSLYRSSLNLAIKSISERL